MYISFLLGSGVSIPAEMPSTDDITKQILCGNDIMRHTDSSYYFGPPLYAHLGQSDEYVPSMIEYMHILKKEIDWYYKEQHVRDTNYEDLYYVASQIHDSESGEYDNPAVQALIDKILPDIQPILDGNKRQFNQQWNLIKLAREATHNIHDVVSLLLNKEPNRLDHLNSIIQACNYCKFSNIDIFTLNHDTVLEQCFEHNEIPVSDGFGKPENNMRYWEPNLFNNRSDKVRLFKLHGSVNWFRFRPDDGDRSNDFVGIPLVCDINHMKNRHGIRLRLEEERPKLLIGTFNKILQYTSGIFTEIYCQFYHSLKSAERLIISGYSFGDKAINSRIINWIYSDDWNKIILIHPESDNLHESARGAIADKLCYWKKQEKLIIIPKRIEETSWQDIKEHIFKSN